MDDEGIIALYYQRNEQAIIETSIKYGAMCMKIAMNILLNREDSEESVNDTYLFSWNNIPPKNPPSLKAFVARVVRFISRKRREKDSAKKRKPESMVDFDSLADYLESYENMEKRYESKALGECLARFLDGLKQEERLIFMRKYFFLDSNNDIAQRFNMKVGTVDSSLFRTRKKLKEYLRKEGHLK